MKIEYYEIQILRTPQILEIAESLSIETWGDNVSSKQAKNIARKFCLPFFKEIDESSNEAFIINALFEPMKNMLFGVGIGRSKSIITSDKPIYVCGSDFPCEEYDEIIFPVSSELCFFLFGNENKAKYRKNFLFPIGDEIKQEIIKSMAASSFGKLYSNHILTKMERKYIKEYILEEWDALQNGELTPDMVTWGSHKRIHWKCKKGHMWEAVVKERTKIRGNRCPECRKEL